MSSLDDVVRYLDIELRTSEVPDYDAALNGLQLANGGSVTRVAAAVDFSSEVVERAVSDGADLLLVHHGMFWRGNQRIVGPAYTRLRRALAANLAVYSSHIPLDLHPRFGNNALLSRELHLESDGAFGRFRDVLIGLTGTCDLATSELVSRATAFAAPFDTTPVVTRYEQQRRTQRWALITGAGASPATFSEARERGVDTLIVGEGTHHTAVEAIEQGLVVIYAGHYATETLGVRALAQHLAQRFGLTSTFVNAPTGL
jgi:dinuclear metal center YbgI/SA1388 family protein